MNHLVYLGDIEFKKNDGPFLAITNSVTHALERGGRVVSMGENFPIIEAFAQKYDTLEILHLNTHQDLYDSLGGNIYSMPVPLQESWKNNLPNGMYRQASEP